MTTRRTWASLVSALSLSALSLSLSSLALLACGGAVGEGAPSASSGPVAEAGAATDGGLAVDASVADSATPDATHPTPGTGVLWVHAEATGFDPHACDAPAPNTDFAALGDYLYAQIKKGGLTGANVNMGGGTCAFGVSPTTLSETYVFTGTVAAAQALRAAPPAPFRGTYVTVPLVVKEALHVKFELFVKDGAVHVFDDVWVHDGLDFDGEAAFMSGICNEKASFDAAIVTSPMGAAVKAWLAGRNVGSVYGLGYDATFYFDDGTTTKVSDAHEAAGGPYLVPCPNLVATP